MYTIGQISEMFGLPISTLRYYDKEGLFPGMQRTSGIRRFGDREIEALRVIEEEERGGGTGQAAENAGYDKIQVLVLRTGDEGRK